MDEIVRCLQGHLKKIALDRLGSLSVWMGVGRTRRVILVDRPYRTMQITDKPEKQQMTETELSEANVIEFYVPVSFVRPVRWIPAGHCGKLLPFRPNQKKTA